MCYRMDRQILVGREIHVWMDGWMDGWIERWMFRWTVEKWASSSVLILFLSKGKVKVTHVQALRLCTGCKAHRGSRGIALLLHYHGTRRRWGVSVTPRPLFTPGKDPVPIVQEAVWAPGPVWTGAENIAPPPGFDPRTFQPVASRYTDWATRRTPMFKGREYSWPLYMGLIGRPETSVTNKQSTLKFSRYFCVEYTSRLMLFRETFVIY